MNSYLIATETGGLPEMPKIEYEDYDVIWANSRNEAIDIYNKLYNCSFFYGVCMAEKIEGEINIINDSLTIQHLAILKQKNL